MLKQIAIGVLVVVLVFMGIGMVLPGAYDVARAGTVSAPPDEVWNTVATLETWPEWSAWSKEKDPTVEFTFSGEKTGVGAVWSWKGDEFGVGTMTITEAVPGEVVAYELEMEGMEMKMGGRITFEDLGDATGLTFRGTGDLGLNPMFRWMGLAMDGMLGGDFEQCLTGLQTIHGTRDGGESVSGTESE